MRAKTAGRRRVLGLDSLSWSPARTGGRRSPPTGGPRSAERGEGEGVAKQAELQFGPGRGKWAGGGENLGREKEKEKKGGAGPAGLKARGGKRKDFAFLKLNQTIQFKLKFREFKFEPNNKQ